MKGKIGQIVTAAMLSAIICVVTLLFKLPLLSKGYVHLGDALVVLTGCMLSPVYSFLAAGIGSLLADILSGYAVYAPVSFLLKGLMALIVYFMMHKFSGKLPVTILFSVIAVLTVVVGYFVYELFLYGFGVAIVNVWGNVLQSAVGTSFGIILYKAVILKFTKRRSK